MPFLLVRHKIEDYAKWKPVFDADRENRKPFGSKGGYLFRNADEPNEIVVLLEWDDLKKAKGFVASEGLKERMAEGGVINRPDIWYLEEIERPAV